MGLTVLLTEMKFIVSLTDDAIRDLEDINGYISEHDSPEDADYVSAKIEETISSLAESAEQGTYPKELLDLGIKEYQEVSYKLYRIIYRVVGKNIYVYIITDGSRDMQTLLGRRLLSAW